MLKRDIKMPFHNYTSVTGYMLRVSGKHVKHDGTHDVMRQHVSVRWAGTSWPAEDDVVQEAQALIYYFFSSMKSVQSAHKRRMSVNNVTELLYSSAVPAWTIDLSSLARETLTERCFELKPKINLQKMSV